MDSKQFYKETFDSIQMSEESIRKVKNMSENNKKKRRLKNGFRAAIAAASLVAVFAIGNAAVYAATGSSLVEKAAEKMTGELKNNSSGMDIPSTRLQKDGKKTYLLVGGEEEDKNIVDITKDFEDGKAEGSVIYNGIPYLYKVSGTAEKHNITIETLPVGYTEKKG